MDGFDGRAFDAWLTREDPDPYSEICDRFCALDGECPHDRREDCETVQEHLPREPDHDDPYED